MNDRWIIDPSHPFDSIGYINKKRRGLFGKKKERLIIHESWLKYVSENIDDKKEVFFYSLTVRDAAGNMLNVEREPVKVYELDETVEKKDPEWIDDF